ncbi:endonuclease domain-containing protein [Streptosporangium sp. NPDC051023]|uniref:endonuclease domain-containing protein n=1 Tax=Streptosporangium sp. NPDC051023 TaxID=3155410 RepID=UPI003450CBB2
MPEEQAWRAFAKAHNNRCALCRVPDNEKMVDHDHTTGQVRGLLCRSCNHKALSGIRNMALSRYRHLIGTRAVTWDEEFQVAKRARKGRACARRAGQAPPLDLAQSRVWRFGR